MGIFIFDRIPNVELEQTGPVNETFMLRMYVPNGTLRADQLRCIARLAEEHAGGLAALTMRSSVQLDGLTVESLHEILEELCQKGLTRDDQGNDRASITGCPVAGIDAGEICDVSPLILRAREMLIEDASFYNLPRKLRVGVSACQVACFPPDTTDIALIATKRKRNGTPEVAFTLSIGGQLSPDSHRRVCLPAFVQWEQVLFVLRNITKTFSGSGGIWEGDERAVPRHAWSVESFLSVLQEHLGFLHDVSDSEATVLRDYSDHVGIYPQKQPGRFYAGLLLRDGSVTAAEMTAIADLAERYGSGDLRITNMQNLIILNVSKNNVDPLAAELKERELRLQRIDRSCGSRLCQVDRELPAMLAQHKFALAG
jgi:sulfite reductase (ferredoxin)